MSGGEGVGEGEGAGCVGGGTVGDRRDGGGGSGVFVSRGGESPIGIGGRDGSPIPLPNPHPCDVGCCSRRTSLLTSLCYPRVVLPYVSERKDDTPERRRGNKRKEIRLILLPINSSPNFRIVHSLRYRHPPPPPYATWVNESRVMPRNNAVVPLIKRPRFQRPEFNVSVTVSVRTPRSDWTCLGGEGIEEGG